MKTLKYYLLSVASLCCCSCEDMLQIYPDSELTADKFYQNPDNFNQLLNSVYSYLQSTGQYGENFHFLMEVPSDNTKEISSTIRGGYYYDFEVLQVASTNPVVERAWVDCYKAIQASNVFLARTGQVSMDAKTLASRTGEAFFLRALNYFNLVRLWGDVPLVITETKDPSDLLAMGRIPANEVYAQIILDLQEAIKLLPSTQTDKGRVTLGAAHTLLGKIYLTRKNYTDAVSSLRRVTGYQLIDFASIFGPKNEYNAESIFEVNFTANLENEGSVLSNLFAPTGEGGNLSIVGAVYNQNAPTTELYNLYAANDKRRDQTIGIINNKMYPKKYVIPTSKDGDSDINVMVFRYADVVLMLAEALNEIGYEANGEALNLLNQIRERAGIAKYTSQDLPDQATFRDAVAAERRLELAYENHRWFDLVRTGKAIEVMNNSSQEMTKFTVKAYQLLFPIPQREIDANPLKIKQNPEY